MDLNYIRILVDHLDARGVLFAPGLSDQEVATVEATFRFRFPPDLRKLLQRALPISERFPNWRRDSDGTLRHVLAAPIHGILYGIECGDLWPDTWGVRPAAEEEAVAGARLRLERVPVLIPIYGHHYIPADPHSAGNPVFSVVQGEVGYQGCDLTSYFAAEFGVPCPSWAATTPAPTPFWDTLVS